MPMSFNPTKLFIRGGQTFLHNVRMFTQVGKKVSFAFILINFLLIGCCFYLNTTQYERYIGTQYLKAQGLILINSKSRQVVIMPRGDAYPVYSGEIIKSPLVRTYLYKLKQSLILSLTESLLASLGVLILIVKWLQKRGENQSKPTIIRGFQLVDTPTLKKCIKKKGKVSPYTLAGISLPKGSETQHIQVIGTTGAGKTAVIRELLATIRQRGERAIIYDKGGTYLSRFYREGQDVILNPLDNRGKSWNVWAECEDKADLEALAEALMPMPLNNTMDPFWIKAARMIFVATANELKNNPNRSNLMLLQYLLTADLDSIHQLLRHTEAESLVSSKVQKTALNVKTVMATYLKSLLYLNDEKGKEIFSIRDWILNDRSNSCLFVSSDGRKHPTIRPLISAWINTATKELLSLSPNDNRRIWFILDELASMHMLPFLATAKAEGRKFGGCFFLGYHGASQLRLIYGNDGAAALSNLCSTRFFLRCPEFDDAESASKNIGTYEIEEANESVSYGANTMRDGISVSRHVKEKRVALPTEVQALDDLSGYLRVKGELPPAKVCIKYVEYPESHPEFIARTLDTDPLRQKVEALVDSYSDPLLASEHETTLTGKNEVPSSTTPSAKRKTPELNKEKEMIAFL